MTFDELTNSTKRIHAFYRHPHKEDEIAEYRDYMSAVYEVVKWMNTSLFDDVCKELVLELNPMKKPGANMYLACYRRMNSKESVDGDTSCPYCKGVGTAQDWIMREHTGEIFDAVRSCSRCRPNVKVQTRSGFRCVTKQEYDLQEESIKATRIAETATIPFDERPEV